MTKEKQAAKRGRPARLSRDQILQAALKLLESGPTEVTIKGVARALKVAPMSLYTHVKNRDDLLRGIAELVISKLELTLDANSWEGNVRLWVEQVRAHFARYPQIVKLLGESQEVPLEWLRLQIQLVTVLEHAGLKGADLSSTSSVLSQAVTYDCIQAGTHVKNKAYHARRVDLEALSASDRANAELLIDSPPMGGHSLLDFTLEQMFIHIKKITKDE